MDFDDLDAIRQHGFQGFVPVSHLRTTRYTEIPTQHGVYLFLRLARTTPEWLDPSPAGWYKRKNPTVSKEELQAHWVDGPIVVYIGKAGAHGSKRTLRKRILEALQFGAGLPVRHWGGRYLWQLKDANELVVCWKPTPGDHPRTVERQLIQAFRNQHHKRPFANLQD